MGIDFYMIHYAESTSNSSFSDGVVESFFGASLSGVVLAA